DGFGSRKATEDPNDNDVTLTGLDGGDSGDSGDSGSPEDPGALPIGADSAEQVVHEANLADGSRPNDAALSRTGSFGVSAPDGLASLTIAGVRLDLARLDALAEDPLRITTDQGMLTLIDYQGAALGGTVSYVWTLTSNVDNDSLAGATDGG